MLSARLKAIVETLPLKPGLRVLEIGCGPGAAAREVAARIGSGYVLGIDRSARANLSFRVGALDGRHPELEHHARERIRDALTSRGRL